MIYRKQKNWILFTHKRSGDKSNLFSFAVGKYKLKQLMQDTPLWKPHSSPVHNSSFSSMRLRRPVVDTRELKAWFSLAVQAQEKTQWFLFHRENGLDAGTSTSASTRIKILPFSCACAYAFVLQQMKTKYRSGIAQAQGYLPHVVKFD